MLEADARVTWMLFKLQGKVSLSGVQAPAPLKAMGGVTDPHLGFHETASGLLVKWSQPGLLAFMGISSHTSWANCSDHYILHKRELLQTGRHVPLLLSSPELTGDRRDEGLLCFGS